jgi:16S rRNA processing protein RimM
LKRIVVGKIAKPQGIKGEVKLQCYVDAPEGFLHIKEVYVGDVLMTVERARCVGADVFLTLAGVTDRNTAETLRNREVSVPRECADSLKSGEYFIADLIGLRVVAEDIELGTIKDVLQYGAADIFDIRGDKQYLVPFLKALVLSVDLEAGVMTVDKHKWAEVACEN